MPKRLLAALCALALCTLTAGFAPALAAPCQQAEPDAASQSALDKAERAAAIGEALKQADPSGIERFLAQGLDPDTSLNEEGETLLHRAASSGRLPLIEHLLARGARLDRQDLIGRTPLDVAAWEGRLDAVKLLLAKGGQLEPAGRITPLMWAASRAQREVVLYLLARGAKVEARDHRGMTALMMAAFGGYHYSAPDGLSTAMYYQLWEGEPLEMMRLLLERGANLGARTDDGRTVMMYAAQGGRSEVVEWLLATGADYLAQDAAGYNALYYAAHYHMPEVANLLIARGARF